MLTELKKWKKFALSKSKKRTNEIDKWSEDSEGTS